MAGNPVLGFLEARPTGNDPHSTVTKMLRWLGIAILAWFAFSVLNYILQVAMGNAYLDGPGNAINAASAVIGIVIAAVITGLVLWWITFTVTAWTNNDARGSTHALIIAILATVFGGLGVLGGLAGAGLGMALYGAGVSVLATAVGVLSLLVSAFELYCGIMILVNRGKVSQGSTARATGN